MPKVSDVVQSKYLKKEDCGRGILVTIRGYEHVNVALQGEKPDMKFVLFFNEAAKGLVINSTNAQLMENILGSDDFDDWIGHKIVLYEEPNISYGGKLVGGIRVRAPRNQAPAPAPTQPRPVSAPIQAPPAAVPPPAPPYEPTEPVDDVPF